MLCSWLCLCLCPLLNGCRFVWHKFFRQYFCNITAEINNLFFHFCEFNKQMKFNELLWLFVYESLGNAYLRFSNQLRFLINHAWKIVNEIKLIPYFTKADPWPAHRVRVTPLEIFVLIVFVYFDSITRIHFNSSKNAMFTICIYSIILLQKQMVYVKGH